MSKESAQHFYETGEGFVSDLDWNELRSYLIPFQDDISLIDTLFNQKIIKHLNKCRNLKITRNQWISSEGSFGAL